jgi:hypothetical protein
VKLLRLPRIRNAFVLRTILVWAALRLALAYGGVLDPELGTELVLVPLVAGTVVLDARRRREDILLGNLGIPSRSIAVLAMPVVAVLEALIP